MGARGNRVRGIDEARANHAHLIAGHLALTPIYPQQASTDHVAWIYGLGVDSLQMQAIASAETIGEFYIRDGKVVCIIAHFLPSTLVRVAPPTP